MANNIHKGKELNNIKETWEQNERNRDQNRNRNSPEERDEITRVIQEEAAEYDNMNSDEKLLGGERATINDDDLTKEPKEP